MVSPTKIFIIKKTQTDAIIKQELLNKCIKQING